LSSFDALQPHREPSETRFPPWLNRRAPLLLFLALYSLTVSLTFRQFGTTWDEGDVYVSGWRLEQSFLTGNPGLLVEKHEDPDGNEVYNHTYGMFLSALNPSTDLETFHRLNLTTATLGYVASYELLLLGTGNPWAALLGPAALFLNPRFSGDTPANPKDAPYAVFYLCFLALLACVPERRPFLKTALLGAFLFLACAQRISGFSLLLPAALWRWTLASKEDQRTPGRGLLSLGVLASTSFALLFATWPYLRLAPWDHLKEIVHLALRFPYNGDVLFLGKVSKAHDLPASYPWVWLGIAVPVGLLLFSAASYFFSIRSKPRPVVSLVAWTLLLNLTLLLATRPSLYDGLRHLLYLLPLISVLAAFGIWEAWRRLPSGFLRTAFALSLGLYGASLGFRMMALHPYEYIYFNDLSGGLKGAAGRFDTDYWGASYREAALWLRENELAHPTHVVTIHTKGNALQTLAYLSDLPIHWGTLEEADYFIASTRWNENLQAGDRTPLHVVSRDGVPLCYIYRMK